MTFPFPLTPRVRIGGNDAYTKSLLHFDGTDGATSITDSNLGGSAKVWTANGNAQVDTSWSKFGGASALFDGTGDYFAGTDNADWTFGTQNFSIDFWTRITTLSRNQGFVGQTVDTNNRFLLYLFNDNTINFQVTSGGVALASYGAASGFSTGVDYHIEATRSGANFYIFVNGSPLSLTTNIAISTNSLPDLAATFDLGRAFVSGAQASLDGWIDEFRVSVGMARHTAAFTPPTSPYT